MEDDSALLERLRDSDYPGKVERAILFEIEACDVNCPPAPFDSLHSLIAESTSQTR